MTRLITPFDHGHCSYQVDGNVVLGAGEASSTLEIHGKVVGMYPLTFRGGRTGGASDVPASDSGLRLSLPTASVDNTLRLPELSGTLLTSSTLPPVSLSLSLSCVPL